MRIQLICGSLESSKDGVGDYTRRLAGELIRQGHVVHLVALHDHHIQVPTENSQFDFETEITCNRLPTNLTWNEKTLQVQKIIDNFNPQWISVQYVPHSYNSKGLPFGLLKLLNSLNVGKSKWHLMLHELWVGELKSEGIKLQCIRYLEQIILDRIIRCINPSIIHTSNHLYKSYLSYRLHFSSDILPVFSNIPEINTNNNFFTLNEEIKKIINNRNDYFIVTNFGSYYHKWWNLTKSIPSFISLAKNNKKKLVLASLGKLSIAEKKYWKDLCLNQSVEVLFLGIQSEQQINIWLKKYTDLSVVTTPYLLLGKSGAFQAMKLFKVPVITLYKNFNYRIPIFFNKSESDFYFLDDKNKIVKNTEKIDINSSLENVAYQFLQALKSQY